MSKRLIYEEDAIDALMEILDRPNHAEFLYTDEICKALEDLPSAQPKKVYIAEIKIDGDEMQKCVDKAVNRILYDAYQPLTEEDYTSLRERFGAEVEKTVREMAEGNANRWMI